MVQEFITSNGKVIRERDVLFVKTLKHGFWSPVLHISLPFFILIIFILQFFRETDLEFAYYFRIIFWGFLLSSQVPILYDILIKRSFSNRIPLSRILSFEVKPDEVGLETFVILKLKSGRNRKINFRTLEKQYEPFTELVSQHIIQPQFA